MIRRIWCMVAATTLLCYAGCDAPDEETSASLQVYMGALSGGACGDASNPTPGANPFSDLTQVTVSVKGTDTAGQFTTLVKATRKLGGQSLTLADVPEGDDREVIVYGEGTKHSWYARDTGVTITRSANNQVDLLLAPLGDFACVEETTNAYPNVVFPATVALGDGKVLITGGFTRVLPQGAKSYLEGPTDAAAIFDPRTGVLKSIQPMGESEGRAGHAMVFIPSTTGLDKGKVLVVGGLDRLEVDETRGFPFVLDDADARNDYLLFDVSTEQFIVGAEVMDKKRGFPRAHLMADHTVVITGGGEWPNTSGAYKEVEVFDPDGGVVECPEGGDPLCEEVVRGEFLEVSGFSAFWPRSGHSLSFLSFTPEGLTQLLMWGGSSDDNSNDVVAEVITQSAAQREGIDGRFEVVEWVGSQAPPFTAFHEMIPLRDLRFLLVGGVRFGASGLEAPAADEAWLISYDPGSKKVLAEQKPGLGLGRVFHSAFSSDQRRVTVAGGWGGGSALASDTVMFFDCASSNNWEQCAEEPWTSATEDAGNFASRGGHGSLLLASGSILLVGGDSSLTQIQDGGVNALFMEIYTPSNVDLP